MKSDYDMFLNVCQNHHPPHLIQVFYQGIVLIYQPKTK